jgi:hypothetical protein
MIDCDVLLFGEKKLIVPQWHFLRWSGFRQIVAKSFNALIRVLWRSIIKTWRMIVWRFFEVLALLRLLALILSLAVCIPALILKR